MTDKIKIDIVSDVVCPWCIIGYKRLEKAIDELGMQENIELEWQPFQLNPHVGSEGENLREHLMGKYGMSREDSDRNRQNLTNLGQELGFQFTFFDEMKTLNTRDAHILLEYAKEQGKQTALKLRLFDAYFSEKQDISNRDTLAKLLEESGLSAEEGIAKLEDAKAAKSFADAQNYWRGLGVSSVPTIVFNRESAVTGAQPVDVLKQILKEMNS
ncbi:DSBA-like thioredoxin domain protein [Grimontia celer]|uniref:DSBA-like thioredoxin domain protein n=1 Tax=Grimontia celer TaxID=1796497 RepID=A0A128F456_9GAMM|nr:DsbA family oxidoreductase [Grimontia celer]CZF81071.1 DSBA-like thioredoxin domain protein [Grimontia celer]